MLQKPLVQFWHFLGSNQSNFAFTSTLCYLAKKIQNVTKTSSSILTLLGEQSIKLRLYIYSELLCEKNPIVTKTSTLILTLFREEPIKLHTHLYSMQFGEKKSSSSILTLLGEQLIKLRLHLYSMLFGEKNSKCYKNL